MNSEKLVKMQNEKLDKLQQEICQYITSINEIKSNFSPVLDKLIAYLNCTKKKFSEEIEIISVNFQEIQMEMEKCKSNNNLHMGIEERNKMIGKISQSCLTIENGYMNLFEEYSEKKLSNKIFSFLKDEESKMTNEGVWSTVTCPSIQVKEVQNKAQDEKFNTRRVINTSVNQDISYPPKDIQHPASTGWEEIPYHKQDTRSPSNVNAVSNKKHLEKAKEAQSNEINWGNISYQATESKREMNCNENTWADIPYQAQKPKKEEILWNSTKESVVNLNLINNFIDTNDETNANNQFNIKEFENTKFHSNEKSMPFNNNTNLNYLCNKRSISTSDDTWLLNDQKTKFGKKQKFENTKFYFPKETEFSEFSTRRCIKEFSFSLLDNGRADIKTYIQENQNLKCKVAIKIHFTEKKSSSSESKGILLYNLLKENFIRSFASISSTASPTVAIGGDIQQSLCELIENISKDEFIQTHDVNQTDLALYEYIEDIIIDLEGKINFWSGFTSKAKNKIIERVTCIKSLRHEKEKEKEKFELQPEVS